MTERRWWAGSGAPPIDAATGYGLAHRDALPLSSLEDVPCLVLVGDSGLGKSRAMDDECRRLQREHRKVLPHLLRAADDAAEVRTWLEQALAEARQGSRVHLFLDGLDEVVGSMKNLVVKLTATLLGAVDLLSNLRLRIFCRTSALPGSLRPALARAYGESDVQVRALLPLTEAEVSEVARVMDPEVTAATLDWLRTPRLSPLASRPMALRLLLNVARDPRGATTVVGPFAAAVSWLARDPDPERQDASLVGVADRLGLAQEIAVLCVLGERSRVDLAEPPLVPAALTAENLRPLASLDRVREVVRHSQLFHEEEFLHRSIAEWLAAERLSASEDVDGTVARLFGPAPQGRVVPQLRGLAVLLARRRRFFVRIVRRDPFTLLELDPADIEDDQRELLLDAVFAHPNDPDTVAWPEELARRLAARAPRTLASKLEAVIFDRAQTPRKRRLAIELVEESGLDELTVKLVPLALSAGELLVRVAATRAVATRGGDTERRALTPLIEGDRDDEDDALKGIALHALWPSTLSAGEVFTKLPPPRNPRLFGDYQSFVGETLLAHLQRRDLPVALRWAAATLQPLERWPPSHMLERLLALALQDIEEPDIDSALGVLLLAQIKGGEHWVPPLREALRALGEESRAHARRVVLETLVRQASSTQWPTLHWQSAALLEIDDLPWLLDRVEESSGTPDAERWLRMTLTVFWPVAAQVPEVSERLFAMAEGGQDEAVRARLQRELLESSELDDEGVRMHRETVQRRLREDREREDAEQTLAAEIESLVARASTGDVEALWRAVYAINSEVRVDGQVVSWSYRRLSTSAWWTRSADAARARFLASARDYLSVADPMTDDWFGRGVRYAPAVAGRLALMLLQETKPEALDALPASIWQRWTPSLLDPEFIAEEGPRDAADALLRRAYAAAPEAFLERTIALATAEIAQGLTPSSLRSARPVYDARWARPLRDLAALPTLRAASTRATLLALAAVDARAALTVAARHVSDVWEATGDVVERAVEAAAFLLSRAPDESWATLAPRFEARTDLGLRVVRRLGETARQLRSCPPFERPDPLAAFYRWVYRADKPAHSLPGVADASIERHARDVTWTLSAARERLTAMGTPDAVAALESLRRSLPDDEALAFAVADAREQCLLAQWHGWPISVLIDAYFVK